MHNKSSVVCMCVCVVVRARVICTNKYNLIEYKIYKKKKNTLKNQKVCMYVHILGDCVHAHMCE